MSNELSEVYTQEEIANALHIYHQQYLDSPKDFGPAEGELEYSPEEIAISQAQHIVDLIHLNRQ